MSRGYVSDESESESPRGMPVVDADPFKREMETTIYEKMNDTVRKYTQNTNDLRTVAEIMKRIRPLLTDIIKPILVANKSYLLQQRGIAQGSNVNEYSPIWFANAISNVFPNNSEMFSKMLMRSIPRFENTCLTP